MQSSLPSIQQIQKLHRKYAHNDKVYERVYGHCSIVAEIALWCVDNIVDEDKKLVDRELLEKACLLHDIGTYVYFDKNVVAIETHLYVQHAVLGAKLLADDGIDSRIVDIVSTHVLMGLSKQEIIDIPLPLPAKDYQPSTIEGEILCYADRFHSKHPVFNGYDNFLNMLKEKFPLQAEKFELWSERFGIPDVEKLAHKHDHPLR